MDNFSNGDNFLMRYGKSYIILALSACTQITLTSTEPVHVLFYIGIRICISPMMSGRYCCFAGIPPITTCLSIILQFLQFYWHEGGVCMVMCGLWFNEVRFNSAHFPFLFLCIWPHWLYMLASMMKVLQYIKLWV